MMSHFSSSNEELSIELNAPQLISQYFLVLLGSVDVDPSSSASTVIGSAVDTLCEKPILVHTILMKIFSDQIVIFNSKNICCCSFTASLMDFVIVHQDNRQLFGIVTRDEADGQLKCYVFGVDEQLIFHSIHANYTSKHGISCTMSCKSGSIRRSFCDEFPHCAFPILEKMRFMLNAPKIIIPERVCHVHLTPNDSRISALTVETDDSVYSVTQRFNNIVAYEEESASLGYLKRSSSKSSNFIKGYPKSATDVPKQIAGKARMGSTDEILRLKRLSNVRVILPEKNEERVENDNAFKMQLVDVSFSQSQRSYGSELKKQCSQSQCHSSWFEQEQKKSRILTSGTCNICSDQSLPSFEDVFTDNEVRSSFRKFLESEVSAENLDFYFMAEFFCEHSSNNTIYRLALEIYNKFFAPESMQQVNVDSEVLKLIREAISSNKVSSDLYCSAQKQVRSILKYDCWPRYIAKIKETHLVVDSKHHRSLLRAWKERFFRCGRSSTGAALTA